MSEESTAEPVDPLNEHDEHDPFSLLNGTCAEKVKLLFGYISRIEYALMLQGFANPIENKPTRLIVNWKRFAESKAGTLSALNSSKLKESIDYLVKCPPMQFKNDFKWHAREYEAKDADSIAILAAKDVRNNLFHGLKYRNPDHERNNQLLDAACNVMKGILIANKDLFASYNT